MASDEVTLNYNTVDEANKAFWIASVGAVEKSAAAGAWQVTANDGTVIKFRVRTASKRWDS